MTNPRASTLRGKDARNSLVLVPELEAEDKIDNPGCGILAKYPLASVLIFALTGMGIGIGLSNWSPDNPETKDTVVQWLGLPGDLFIRSLKCIVLPMVFVSMIVSMVDMMTVGKAGAIAKKTILFYLFTTIMAATFGVISIMIFESSFSQKSVEPAGPTMMKFGCNIEGTYITEKQDGSLMCAASTANVTSTEFVVTDVSGAVTASGSEDFAQVSLSDTFYQGIFLKIVPDNIINAFSEGNFLSVLFFAAMLGLALGTVLEKKLKSEVMPFLEELLEVFILFINWVIKCTPFAVASLIANAIGGEDDLGEAFKNVGYLVLAVVFGMALHIFFVFIVFHWLVTKSNPFTYLSYIFPAQIMAFACSSSAATLPVTLETVQKSKVVPEAVARFVLPLGATINMDGSAIYFPIACVWLAVLNGIEVTAANLVLLVIVSSFGSAGAAPVPSAGLVLVITAYNTVFGTTGTPNGFSFIVAIDWFLDRLQTSMNVTGDAVVARMIAHTTKLGDLDGLPQDSSSQDEDA
jgi:Na+/H+-dicarboxylate symporter